MDDRPSLAGAVQLVHELPRRLRLRVPWLAARTLDAVYLQAYLEALDGVGRVRVRPAARSVAVEYDGRPQVKQALLQQLAAPPAAVGARARPAEVPPSRFPILASGLTLLCLPLVPAPVGAGLTLAAVSGTLVKGAATLLRRGVKVEVLDALAVGFAGALGHYYSANVTNLLLSAGDHLQHTTERRSDQLLKSLLQRPRGEAWVERAGAQVQLPADEVRVGDSVIVGVDDQCPVDGRVVDGLAVLDQASLTGESVPVRKEVGDRVAAGSVVVEGRLRPTALQVGQQTSAARIALLIEQALQQPSRRQREVDRLAERLVLLVTGVGVLVYLATRQLRRLVPIFLVDYSCALKLGSAVAFKAGLYQSAQRGIVFKGAAACEALAAADTLVFDKTGTLTYGRLEVSDVISLSPARSEADLLALVAALEEHVNHPFADAIIKLARAQRLPHVAHSDVEYVVGHGLNARVQGEPVAVGSRHYLETVTGVSFAAHAGRVEELEAAGKSVLYVALGGRPLGLIAQRDRLRPDAVATLRALRAAGVQHFVLLTGDRRHKAEALAARLGVDRLHAELGPEQKAQVVRELAAAGRTVAYVGDGVNDAPAMASAAAGVCMPRGALLSRETADVLLLQDRLYSLVEARRLAAATLRLVRANFGYAVGINSAILAGASAGWLPPIAAALLHNGGTLGILLNAQRGPAPGLPAQRQGAVGGDGELGAEPDFGRVERPGQPGGVRRRGALEAEPAQAQRTEP